MTLARPQRGARARTLRIRNWAAPRRADLLAVGLLVIVGLLLISPSIIDGMSFGGFDYDTSRLSPLGAGLYSVVHSTRDSDAVSQMVAWNALNWIDIHSWHFPLWNPYSGLGMPEFLNFESSVLSLPDLVSYVFPLRSAFLVAVEVKLLLAGTGTYAFMRVMRQRTFGALIGAITFMLGGAFAGSVTWPTSDVFAWAGWICAAVVLTYRGVRRAWSIALLAGSVAFCIYGGFPEANVIMVVAIGVFFAAMLVHCVSHRRSIAVLSVLRVLYGTGLGVALAAPLWFPGIQVIDASLRTANDGFQGIPYAGASLLISPSFYGVATGPNEQFQIPAPFNYYQTVSYVGVIALILAACAVFVRRRDALVIASGCGLVVSMLLTYESNGFHPLQSLVEHIPHLSEVDFSRSRTMVSFFIAILAGIGVNAIFHSAQDRRTRRALLGSSALFTSVVTFLAIHVTTRSSSPAFRELSSKGLVWPLGLSLVALVIAVVMLFRPMLVPSKRAFSLLCATAILVGQGAFLFFATVGLYSYSKTFYGTTTAERQLKQIVGTSLLGYDTDQPETLRKGDRVGFFPNVNIGYQIRVFAIHDPLIPKTYFDDWRRHTDSDRGPGFFFPDIDSAQLARRFGIDYILAAPEVQATPPGTVKVAELDNEGLYRVPGAQQFTIAKPGSLRNVQTNGQGSFTFTTSSRAQAVVTLRVTALPGWHATSDGRALALTANHSIVESIVVPAGTHKIELWYWPKRLTIGIAVAGLSLLVILAGFAVPIRRSRELLARRGERRART